MLERAPEVLVSSSIRRSAAVAAVTISPSEWA